MHSKQQSRAIEEDDGEHVEGIVEQIAIANGEGRRPIQMRENSEGHSLTPMSHQDWTDEAKHEIEPDCRGKSPGRMRAHAQSAGAPIHAQPPEQE